MCQTVEIANFANTPAPINQAALQQDPPQASWSSPRGKRPGRRSGFGAPAVQRASIAAGREMNWVFFFGIGNSRESCSQILAKNSENLHVVSHLLKTLAKFRYNFINIEYTNGKMCWIKTCSIIFENEFLNHWNSRRSWKHFCWNVKIWAVQKYVNLVYIVKSFLKSIYLRKSASIHPKTSLSSFGSD